MFLHCYLHQQLLGGGKLQLYTEQGSESNSDVQEKTESVNKDEQTKEASKDFLTEITLYEKNSKDGGTFQLSFELGNEIINGVEEPAIAESLYIDELDFSLPLDNLNSWDTELELSGLKNQRYRYYIKSVQGFEYEGYFDVDFVKDKKSEVKPKVTFKGYPSKKIIEGSKIVLTMNTDNVKSKMTFDGKTIGNGKKGKSFKFTVTKNGNYKYSAVSGEKITKGVLKINFFEKIKNNLNVPLAYQYPAHPTGCESYATVAVLKYLGYNISEAKFISKYLDKLGRYDNKASNYDNVFDKYFVGDPSNNKGLLANPPVMIKAVNKYFKEIKSKKYEVVDTTGMSLEKLLKSEIGNGNPAVIWLTIGYKVPVKKYYFKSPRYSPSHTLVLSGYDLSKGIVYLTDSISGKRTMNYSLANKIYNIIGRKSFILKKK